MIRALQQMRAGEWQFWQRPLSAQGGVAVQPDGVGRGGDGLHPGHGLVQIPHDLVAAHDHQHMGRSERDGGHPVGVAVHVVQLAVLGHGVAAGQVPVGTENLPVQFADLLRAVCLASVQIAVIALGQQVGHAALAQGGGTAVGYAAPGGQHLLDKGGHLVRPLTIKGLHLVALHRGHGPADALFHHRLYCFVHCFLLPFCAGMPGARRGTLFLKTPVCGQTR